MKRSLTEAEKTAAVRARAVLETSRGRRDDFTVFAHDTTDENGSPRTFTVGVTAKLADAIPASHSASH